ncbi:hypothetical protein [Kitasatospora paranensis]|uniref:Uncharacterized protein n=1 Tax=Kitasatospora paranensis TaxID=258053 RepID=A0ABW2FTY7_9ACTN
MPHVFGRQEPPPLRQTPLPQAAGPQAAPDGFWDGDFTLHADEPAARPGAPAIDSLGPSGVTVRGRDLAVLLAPSYRRLTGTGSSPAADPAGDAAADAIADLAADATPDATGG